MATKNAEAHAAANKTYEWGFHSDIEQEFAPKGLSEDTVRFISAKKNEPEWMLDWRLKAYRLWLTMTPPDWAKLNIPPIDYQDAYYYAEPKAKPKLGSLDEVDPEILRVYEKLGIPIEEQKVLAGVEGARKVAVDAVFDSVSVATTFRKELEAAGVIFRSISEAIKRISRSRAQVARQGRAAARQLFRGAQLRCLLRRHLRLHSRRACAARWSSPPISASMPKIPASSNAP
jgi:Fe-S cluster assembly protein SufB